MTTPERLRRRQRIESAGIAILAFALVAVFIYFRGQDDAQERCFNNYFQAQAETAQIRSRLVEQESRATRDLLLKGTAAQTKKEFLSVRERYRANLRNIDEARANNPIPPFPEEVCG